MVPFLRAPIREQIPHGADLSLENRNHTELGFASPAHLPQMTSSHGRAIFQASHLWDTSKPSGSGEGKRSTFLPETWDSHWSRSYEPEFWDGKSNVFGHRSVTWTSPRTSLSVSTPPYSVPLIPCLCGPGLVLYQTNLPSDLAQKDKRGPPGKRRGHQEWLWS